MVMLLVKEKDGNAHYPTNEKCIILSWNCKILILSPLTCLDLHLTCGIHIAPVGGVDIPTFQEYEVFPR